MKVNTVNGEIETSELGRTLMHEHLATVDMSMLFAYSDWLDEEEMYNEFCSRVRDIKKYGVKTIVDQLPTNLGRNIHWLREASRRADIQILCATGIYHHETPFFSKLIDPQFLADLMIRDLTVGIQDTEFKAALIKCATDKTYGESEINKSMLKASAIASIHTGVPIVTHSYSKHHQGLYQQRILLENGVEPHKILIGHSFDCLDMNYLENLLNNGTYIGCDQIGITHRATTEELADIVAKLIKMNKGFEKQIFLSHDGGVVNDYGYSLTPWRRDYKKNNTLGTYDVIFKEMIPLLLNKGVLQNQIDTMMIENVKRFFDGEQL